MSTAAGGWGSSAADFLANNSETYAGMTEEEAINARLSEKAREAMRKSDERSQQPNSKSTVVSSAVIRGGGVLGIGVMGMDNSFGVDPTDFNNTDDVEEPPEVVAERKRREILKFRGPMTLTEMRAKAAELQELKERLEKSKSEKQHATELKNELVAAEEHVQHLIELLGSVTDALDDTREAIDDAQTRLEAAEAERRAAAA